MIKSDSNCSFLAEREKIGQIRELEKKSISKSKVFFLSRNLRFENLSSSILRVYKIREFSFRSNMMSLNEAIRFDMGHIKVG